MEYRLQAVRVLVQVVVVLCSIVCFSGVKSQFDVPDNCNRRFVADASCPQDTSAVNMQCLLPDNSSLEFPPPNTRSCFRTCITDRGCGGSCFAQPVRNVINSPLPFSLSEDDGKSYTVTRVFSPRFLNPMTTTYLKSSICRYNVECEPDQLLFYSISEHELEEPAADMLDDDQEECLDFLFVERTDINIQRRTCGETDNLGGSRSGFNGFNLRTQFTTNRVRNSRGYFMTVFCVNPSFYNQVNCLQEVVPAGRKRRSSPSTTWVDRVMNSIRIREKRSFRVPCIIVPTTAGVRYQNSVITVIDLATERVLYKFLGIRILQQFNKVEEYLTFYESYTPFDRISLGYGFLHVGYGLAYYVQTEVDPMFIPTENEEISVDRLFSSLIDVGALESENFDIRDEIDDLEDAQTTPPPTKFPPHRVGRQASTIPDDIMEDVEQGVQSCNGILRAAAETYRRIVLNSRLG